MKRRPRGRGRSSIRPSVAAPDASAVDGAGSVRAAPRDAAAVRYFDAALTYARNRSSERPSRGLVGGERRRPGEPRRDHSAEHAAVPRSRPWRPGRSAAIVVSLNPMYRAPELGEAVRRLRAAGGHLPRRSMGHRLRRGRGRRRIARARASGRAGASSRRRDDARVLPPRATRRPERALRDHSRRADRGRRARRDLRRRRRLAALHLGHDGRAEGRDADPSQSRRQCARSARDHFELGPAFAHFRRGAAVPCHGLRDPVGGGLRGGRVAGPDLSLPARRRAGRVPRASADLHHRRHHRVHRADEPTGGDARRISPASTISIPAARRSRRRWSRRSRSASAARSAAPTA